MGVNTQRVQHHFYIKPHIYFIKTPVSQMTLLIFFYFSNESPHYNEMSQLYKNRAKNVLGTFIELITCECKNMGYLSHYYPWLIIQVEPSPITPFKALSGPPIYQQLFLFGNRDTDRSPCSNLIKTPLNFYTTLAKSHKHCKFTLNTSYKKKYVGQVEVKRNFLNKKEFGLKYMKLIAHCHTSAVILMRVFFFCKLKGHQRSILIPNQNTLVWA